MRPFSQARRVGWQVDGVTDVECDHDLDAVIAELIELHALRRSEFS